MIETLKYIKVNSNNFEPQVGIILGSGLGEFADENCDIALDYNDIPNFIKSDVEGHKNRLVFSHIAGKKIVIMQGRNHMYEGYSMSQITYPVKVMKKLGVKTLILTNAAGATHEDFTPGDLMLITDHINFMGTNPLIGKNDDSLGTRFPDMSEIYNKHLIAIAEKCAARLGIKARHGVYMATTGPSYETPAEIKMARILGADAVGMSTVPEAIVANYCGMDVIGLSCIANYASGVSNLRLTHEEVIETTDKVKIIFKALLFEIIKNLPC